MAKLESLIVDMQLQTAELRKGLDEVKHSLSEVNHHAEGLLSFEVLKEVGHIALEAAEKLGEFALQGGEVADKMGKVAQSVGIPVERFTQLAYAATLSKLSTEEFGAALGKLNIKIAEAAAGNKDAVGLFRALGVNVKDAAGNVRTADAVIGDLAGVFSQLKDGASKGGLAVDLFGKAGKQMLPFLNEGKEGLARLSDEADRFGITISGETVRAATEFNDNIERVKKTVEGVSVQVASRLAPAMVELTNQLLGSKSGAEALKDVVDVLATSLKLLVSTAVAAAAAFEYVGVAIAGGLASAAAAISGDFAEANVIVKDMQTQLGEVSSNVVARMKAIWMTAGEAPKEAAESTKKSADEMYKAAKDIAKGLGEAEAAFKKLTQVAVDYESKVAGFGGGPLDELMARLDKGDLAGELAKIGDKATAMRDRIVEAAKALQQLKELKLLDQLDFQQQQSNRGARSTTSGIRLQASNVGASPMQVQQQSTAGFGGLDDALSKFETMMKRHTEALGTAALLRERGEFDGARAAEAQADAYQKGADNARKAAESFISIDEILDQQVRAQLEGIASALTAAAGNLVTQLGDFGDVAKAAMQGFQAGGIWGALVAALVELFTKFSRFGELIDDGNQIIQDLLGSMGSGLSAVTTGLHSLLGGVGSLLNVVGSLLNGPLRGIGILFDHIGRLLTKVMDGIGPGLDALGGILDAVMGIIDVLDPMKPIIDLLGALFKLVGLALLGLNLGVQKFLAWIFEIIRSVLGQMGLNEMAMAVSEIEKKMQEGADATEKKIGTMWSDLGHTFDEMGKDNSLASRDKPVDTSIVDKGKEAASGLDNLAKATTKATTAVSKLSEQFTNLPQGFKVRLRSFQAMDAAGFDPDALRNGKSDVHLHISGGVMVTLEQLVEAVRMANERSRFRGKGL